jgi:hypothetical protein
MSNTKSNFNRTAGPAGFQQRNGSSGERDSAVKDQRTESTINARELSYAEARDHLNDLNLKGQLPSKLMSA